LEQLEIGKNHYVGVLTLERVDEKSFNKWDDDKWYSEKPFCKYFRQS